MKFSGCEADRKLCIIIFVVLITAAKILSESWEEIFKAQNPIKYDSSVLPASFKSLKKMCLYNKKHGEQVAYDSNTTAANQIFHNASVLLRNQTKTKRPPFPVHIFWHVGSIGGTSIRFQEVGLGPQF